MPHPVQILTKVNWISVVVFQFIYHDQLQAVGWNSMNFIFPKEVHHVYLIHFTSTYVPNHHEEQHYSQHHC